MKFALLLAFVILGVFSQPIEDLGSNVSPLDLTYLFFNAENANNPIHVKSNNMNAVKSTHFKGSRDTLVLIHGWNDNGDCQLYRWTRDNVFLKAKHDLNIIAVDWSPVWKKSNNFGKEAVQTGTFIADFLRVLAQNNGLKYSQVSVVAHSAGGPIAGALGSSLNGQLKSILGLDTGGVQKSHAKTVHYIHTSSLGAFGNFPGHADFYPNGGTSQPGCNDFGCNHWRSIAYFVESINSNRFVAKQCTNINDYKAGKCNGKPSANMGGLNLDTRANGKYYLTTNAASPFARG